MAERESELVLRAAHGDAKALHVLVDQHARHLFAVALSLTGHGADAEDLVQETFMAAFEGLARFEGRSSLRSWLVAILVRQHAAWRRRSRVRRTVLLDHDAPATPADVSETGRVDAKLDLATAMQELSAEHREVLVLREYSGLSYDEIAGALGVPRGTVESRLHRARQELRERMKGYA